MKANNINLTIDILSGCFIYMCHKGHYECHKGQKRHVDFWLNCSLKLKRLAAFLDFYLQYTVSLFLHLTANFLLVLREITEIITFHCKFIPPTLPVILAQSYYVCEKTDWHRGSSVVSGVRWRSGHFTLNALALYSSFLQELPLNTSWHRIKVGYTEPSSLSQSLGTLVFGAAPP